jgi:hypothetical protein
MKNGRPFLLLEYFKFSDKKQGTMLHIGNGVKYNWNLII